ncbi:MAG: fumarylacetoacetate hydrolase family protein [Actinomycetota bacterium]|nr:fumarylacetoacetate hydrolase family protein [Actinomycetota bacterium]
MTVILSPVQVQAFGDALYEARRTMMPIAAFTDGLPALGMEDGYAIQQHLVRRLLDDGEAIVGYKLGLTSAPMQQLLGVDQPDFGPVFASTVYRDGEVLPVDRFIAPRMEAEIAVILGSDLSGPHCTPATARLATRGLVAALEIVDSRIRDWKIKLADTVADLASSGAIALSSLVVPIDAFDPRLVGMVFTRNGEVVATGAGAAALGDPLAAVAWLANTLAPMGVTLPAGSVIMTGALHAMVPVAPGDVFRADFDRLGPITITMARD